MICSSKEWDTCREEKLGCNGCFYEEPNEDELIDSIERKFEEYYYEDTYNLTVKEAIYVFTKNDYSEELVIAASKVLINKIHSLERDITNLKKIEAEHRKINGELRKKEQETSKALELINSYILEILNKQKK